jgi:hypothetical protein
MDEGHIVIDSIASMEREEITEDLARESGFRDAADLLQTAAHGSGNHVYLIRFHYLPPGAWDAQTETRATGEDRPTLLQRIRRSRSPAARSRRK